VEKKPVSTSRYSTGYPVPPEAEDEPIAVTNRLQFVRNPPRAADLFQTILQSQEKARSREEREKQEPENNGL
jgi:hypothetical protein